MSLPVKLSIGTLVGGVTVTGGALVYREVYKTPSKKPIYELIKTLNRDKRLISKSETGNSKEWQAVWKLYKEEYQNKESNPLSINSEQLKNSTSNQDAPTEFMNKCESFSRELVLDEKNGRYQDVIKYCTRNTLVQDLVSESGRKLIDETNGNWSESWKSYRAANSGKGNNQDTWQLSDWESKKNADSTISDNLKVKCKEKLGEEAGVKSVQDFQDVVNWCSESR
ncbi:hypothetical protein MHC_01155 [Mycoplasma haemocanis str. Illinois]|uniref:Uncharacterized protein n=1 Tax=Mycoplasma haemocanis (strain Illinois) TaxID=1111676 RepID=H6N625_MYCHN|nr:hypothetical protein [Mycoplasma haemocanis]AEW45097.1 hypothetical protein MHC_01155 [Mycoplasma haemocanis str. Illinois]